MVKLNMANMNTLFKKGYLLAGVVIAANMFAVNEIKASEENNKKLIGKNIQEEKTKEILSDLDTYQPLYGGKKPKKKKKKFLNSFLESENWINLGVGIFSSIAKNYLKLWDYNPGTYYKFVWLGWRSKRLLNDIFQFDINLNLGRSAFWTILGFISFRFDDNQKTVAMYVAHKAKLNNLIDEAILAAYLFITFLQGLISAPLTVHIAKFDFSISLFIDSIIWEIVRLICWREPSKCKKENHLGFYKEGKDGNFYVNFKKASELYN